MIFMDKQTKVFIIDNDSTSRALILKYLEGIDFVDLIKDISDISEFSKLAQKEDNNIVIIDISDDTDSLFEEINKISKENNSYKFIATSYNISTNFIVEALRSGFDEFLNKPLLKDDLINAIKKTANVVEYSNNSNKGKVLSVFSNKGGLGKTTVAVNLAKDLADSYKEKVVLVDLNMHLGDVTAFLDINPAYDIQYVVDSLGKVDEESIKNMLVRYKSSNLYILADSPYREPGKELSEQEILSFLQTLKKMFSFVIVDNTSTIDSQTKTVFDESDMILFVTTSNLPTIRSCARSLEILDKLNYNDDKIKIILNRFINSEDYKIEDIEAAINKKIFWTIPNNYFTVVEAVNKGITLQELNPDSNVAENYRQLAQNIQQSLTVYVT